LIELLFFIRIARLKCADGRSFEFALPLSFRFFLLQAHYRKEQVFTDEAMAAADRGYRCLLVEDGCGAASARLHDASCENFQRLLGRVASADAVLGELEVALRPPRGD